MGKSPFDRAWIPADLRLVFNALIATAIGTMAGLLVDSGFGLRASVINSVYELLQPLFGLIADFPITQLVIAEYIYRVPIVLIIGMLVGLVLRHIYYRRLLLWSIAVWPVCLVLATLLSSFLARKGSAGVAASSIPGIGSAAEFLIYFLQYSLLLLVILGADTMAARAGRKAGAIRGTW